MKLKKLIFSAAFAGAGAVAYQNRNMLKASLKLEKVHGDLFTRVEGIQDGKIQYLSKNDNQSEELFKDWVVYNSWIPTENIGEEYFFINENGQTLTIEREAIAGGRYILWTASNTIEK